MQITPGVDFDGLEAAGLGYLIEINPVTGSKMYHRAGNDVCAVLDVLGGKLAAAGKLGVEEVEIEGWIDAHYVPTRYAGQIEEMTGWSVWSLQQPPMGAKSDSYKARCK